MYTYREILVKLSESKEQLDEISLSAKGWSLSSDLKGAGAVAKELNLALNDAIKVAKENIKAGKDKAKEGARAKAAVLKAMGKFKKYGTREAEPVEALCSAIQKALKLDDGTLCK